LGLNEKHVGNDPSYYLIIPFDDGKNSREKIKI
jgi:hypothetical protein